VEEEANIIQMGKLAVEEENRTLRDQNFEIQSRARAADAQLKKVRPYGMVHNYADLFLGSHAWPF